MREVYVYLVLGALVSSEISEVKIDCARGDGFYVIGCNTEFHRCHEGNPIRYECPVGLFFNPRRSKCDYKEEITECNHRISVANVIKASGMFSCANRTDGSYSHPDNPCDTQYFTCSYGRLTPQVCPYNQWFNEQMKRCDYKENVGACNMVTGKMNDYSATSSPTPVDYDFSTAQQRQDKQVEPPTSSVEKSEATNTTMDTRENIPKCRDLPDGVYRDVIEKCASHFWKCANHEAFKYKCQDQLFYDAETDKCEHKENIPDCGGIRPPSTPAFDYHHYETDFDCAEKVDGFYEKERCQTRFYSCTGGMAKELHCSANLVFDVRIRACDYPDACNRERTTPLPPVIGGDHGNVGVIKPTFSKLKFDCTGKKDGYYALEKCAGSYIQCVTGTPYQLSCPSGLFFNEYVGQCDYKMKCNEISVATTSPSTTTVVFVQSSVSSESMISQTATQISHASRDIITSTSTKLPMTTSSVHDDSTEVIVPSCANLTNGAHASASCSDRFVECWDGTTTQARCQPGLVFNQYNTQCDHKRNVPDCNPGMEFPLLGTNKSVDTREIPVTTETIGEKITTDPYCEHMPDGVHGSGCQNFFYWCDKGITYKKFCPPELFYNSRSTMCDYKNNIIDCSNQKNLTSVQNYSPFYTPLNYLSPPVTAAPKQVVQIEERIESPATFDCSGRADGLYALHQCTALFVQCWNNNRVPHSCQEGLFYNEKNGMCDYKENVPSCNGISSQAIPSTTILQPTKVSFESVKPLSDLRSFPSLRHKRRVWWLSKRVRAVAPYLATALIVLPYLTTCASFSMMFFMKSFCTLEDAPNMQHLCSGKLDGYYSNGCSSKYYACISQVYYPMNCNADLKFSEENKKCDFDYRVSECSASALTPANPFTDIAGNKVIIAPPAMKKTIPFSCLYKPDGFYAIGKCSSNYASCQQGRMAIGTCLAPLVFNPANGKCDLITNIDYCQSEASSSVTSAAVFQAFAHSTINCEGRSFGWYAISPCSPEWLRCTANGATRGNCWNGRVFNPVNKLCSPRANVAGCNVTPQLPSQLYRVSSETSFLPAIKHATPNYEKQVFQPIQQGTSDYSSLNIFCQEKDDGIYQLGCHASYVVCSDRSTYPFNCPDGMVYNQIKSVCDLPERVSECTTNKLLQQFRA